MATTPTTTDLHQPTPFWSDTDHDRESDYHLCLTCSDPAITLLLNDGKLQIDGRGVALWPCPKS